MTTARSPTPASTTHPLHALKSGVDGPNGVYGDAGTFPSNTFVDDNYWVDVVFK